MLKIWRLWKHRNAYMYNNSGWRHRAGAVFNKQPIFGDYSCTSYEWLWTDQDVTTAGDTITTQHRGSLTRQLSTALLTSLSCLLTRNHNPPITYPSNVCSHTQYLHNWYLSFSQSWDVLTDEFATKKNAEGISFNKIYCLFVGVKWNSEATDASWTLQAKRLGGRWRGF